MNIRWGLRQDYYYVFIQKVKKMTFCGVYSIGVLCSYPTNDNHLSINWFMQGFPFRFNLKVPVEIASSAKITNGHPFIQILVWMDECYKVRCCLASCTFRKKKKAIPSSSSVLCHGDISRHILRAEVRALWKLGPNRIPPAPSGPNPCECWRHASLISLWLHFKEWL